MTGSTFSPTTWRDVDSTKAQPATVGFQGSCEAGRTESIDFLISDDNIVRAIEFLAQDVTFGDKVDVVIVDKDGRYAPPGTVLATPIKEFNCVADQQKQANYEAVVPTKILGGLYFRVTYYSTGLLLPVQFGINLILMKVLV